MVSFVHQSIYVMLLFTTEIVILFMIYHKSEKVRVKKVQNFPVENLLRMTHVTNIMHIYL